jgi:hypothetical protein
MSAGKYAVSGDGDLYSGNFDTVELAVADAVSERGLSSFWVGVKDSPTQPELYWSALDWIDHVSCQDDYNSDFADEWCEATADELNELETSVRAVMTEWLDKHALRPEHFVVRDPVKYTVEDGIPVIVPG